MESGSFLRIRMNRVTVLAWAQAKTILGFDSVELEFDPSETVRSLLERNIPEVRELGHCRVAVNESIVSWDSILGDARELAIIPPVSGG